MQDDILSGYHRDIVKKFSELYGWGVTFRAIILPSFETEYALGISSADENPKVVGGRAETQLYSYWWIKAHENQGKKYGARDKTAEAIAKLRSSILPTIDDVALTRCEISITDGDRSLYADLWRKELKETIEDALKLLIEQGELEPRWHALDRKARIARGRP